MAYAFCSQLMHLYYNYLSIVYHLYVGQGHAEITDGWLHLQQWLWRCQRKNSLFCVGKHCWEHRVFLREFNVHRCGV